MVPRLKRLKSNRNRVLSLQQRCRIAGVERWRLQNNVCRVQQHGTFHCVGPLGVSGTTKGMTACRSFSSGCRSVSGIFGLCAVRRRPPGRIYSSRSKASRCAIIALSSAIEKGGCRRWAMRWQLAQRGRTSLMDVESFAPAFPIIKLTGSRWWTSMNPSPIGP